MTGTEIDKMKAQELKDLAKRPYNGWANWQTWYVFTALTSYYDLYQYALELKRKGKFKKTDPDFRRLLRHVASMEGYGRPIPFRVFLNTINISQIKKALV